MPHQNDIDADDEFADDIDPQLTELVAYLDGELSDDDSSRLERELGGNPPLRSYAESLDRTWQLLDSLGEATASGEFTQKTLASLDAISDVDDSAANQSSRRIRSILAVASPRKMILWAAVGFFGCATGFLLARVGKDQRQDSEDVQLLQQLEMLKDYPKLYSIPDAEFLKRVATMINDVGEKKAPSP